MRKAYLAMIKVEVSDNEVKLTFGKEIWVSTCEEVIKQFKEAKTERERRNLAVIHYGESYFDKILDNTEKVERKPSTLDILEGCAHAARKLYFPDYYDELDDILGPDPYTPLY